MAVEDERRSRSPGTDALAVDRLGVPWRRVGLVGLAGAIATVAIAIAVDDPKLADFVVLASFYAVMAVGFDITIGMTRQFSLGMTACVALGAYTAGLLGIHVTSAPIVGAVCAVAGGAAIAFAMALLATRVREFYFAVLTLAVGLTVQNLAIAWQDLTGGSGGLVGIPGLGKSNIVRPDFDLWLPLAFGSVVVTVVLGLIVRDSGLGRKFEVIARDEELAKAFGIRVARNRTIAMTLSGAVLGFGGFLYARYVQFVAPEIFSITLVISLVLMVYVGGRGSIWGAVLGAFIVRGIVHGFQGHGETGTFVQCAVLLLVLGFFADGIAGGVRAAGSRLRRRSQT